MARGPDNSNAGDALLVAYLDGELAPEARRELEGRLGADASLAARLAALAQASQPLKSSFDALLKAAPRARLDGAYAAALVRASRRRPRSYRQILTAAAAALLLLIGGGAAGYLIATGPGNLFEEADTFEDAWIDAVAGQLSLYNSASVEAIQVSEAEQKASLAKLGQMLKLDLSAPTVEFEGLTLKRAELLHFRGQEIAELLYASDTHGPIALCITAKPGGEEEGEVESRNGLNFTYWAKGGRRFLLIGDAPEDRIEALADKIAERFSL